MITSNFGLGFRASFHLPLTENVMVARNHSPKFEQTKIREE